MNCLSQYRDAKLSGSGKLSLPNGKSPKEPVIIFRLPIMDSDPVLAPLTLIKLEWE